MKLLRFKIISVLALFMLLSACKDDFVIEDRGRPYTYVIIIENGDGINLLETDREFYKNVTITYLDKNYSVHPEKPSYDSRALLIPLYGAYLSKNAKYGWSVRFGEIDLLKYLEHGVDITVNIGNQNYQLKVKYDGNGVTDIFIDGEFVSNSIDAPFILTYKE